MRISSVTAKNYRTLEDFHVTFDGYYITLSGQNNAGKSAIIMLIQNFLEDVDRGYLHSATTHPLKFDLDKTQWSESSEIEVSIEVEIDRTLDSEVFYMIEKLYPGGSISVDNPKIKLTQIAVSGRPLRNSCIVEGQQLEDQSAVEVLKKLQTAKNLVVHNSTRPNTRFYYHEEGIKEIFDVHLNDADKQKIAQAENALEKKIRTAAKQHKEELAGFLGKLQDKYDVEFTTLGRGGSSRFPLTLNLTDKTVDMPLTDWGTGTQNRTRILISILNAFRIRCSDVAAERSGPVVVVEEPESFLHPSAQAEFGKVLNALASELELQVIVTTHSPYMLNQTSATSNILLKRHKFRNKLKQTEVVDTSGEHWMLPFAENLGVVPDEFPGWKQVFSSSRSRVVLVEGDIDLKYFEHFKESMPDIYRLGDDVEIVPYDGKDALKNTQLLKFIVSKFERVFVTFDLDAKKEVERYLKQIGLEEGRDYRGIGIDGAGKDCIEGLLPNKIRSAVYAAELDLVAALGAQYNSGERKSAKSKLKKKLLEAFKAEKCTKEELKPFDHLFKEIAKNFK